MISKNICFFVILSVVIGLVVSYPMNEGRTCFQESCPAGTTGCKKVSKTTQDKASLDETIICLDAQDFELKRFSKQKPNPYGPHTDYESTSYSSSYSYSGGNMKPIYINHNNNIDNYNNKEIEDFS